MFNMMIVNPYETLVHCQYRKLLNPRSLTQRVKGAAKHIERFRSNVEKNQLQDCQSFQNWWQFFANGRRPETYHELQRHKIANRCFVDQIKDQDAARFLKIFGKYEPEYRPKLFGQLDEEFLNCFRCSCKQEKSQLIRKTPKHPKVSKPLRPVKVYTVPDAPQDQTYTLGINNRPILTRYTQKPNTMIGAKTTKSILRHKTDNVLSKKPSRIHNKMTTVKLNELPENNPNEKLNEEEKLNEKLEDQSEEKADKELNKISDAKSEEKADEKLNKTSEAKSEEKADEKLDDNWVENPIKTIPKLRGEKTVDMIKKDKEYDDLLIKKMKEKVHKVLSDKLQEKQDELDEKRAMFGANLERYQPPKVFSAEDKARIEKHATKKTALPKINKSSLSGTRSKRNFSNSGKLSLTGFKFRHTLSLGRSSSQFKKLASYQKSISIASRNTNASRQPSLPLLPPWKSNHSKGSTTSQHKTDSRQPSVTLLQPRKSTSVRSSKLSLDRKRITNRVQSLPPETEQPEDSPRHGRKKRFADISSSSSIFWSAYDRRESTFQSLDGLDEMLSMRYPPMDVTKHVNKFLKAQNFNELQRESGPKNWPKPFKSSIVQNFIHETRKQRKLRKMKSEINNGKSSITMQEKAAVMKPITKASDLKCMKSCEMCSSLCQTEPDQPYMIEMRKRQAREELKKYYRCKLMPSTTLPNIKSLTDQAKELTVNQSIKQKLALCYQMLCNCKEIIDNKLKQRQCSERSM